MADALQVLFAQQPILDLRQEVVAYELLFRGKETVSGEAASASVLLSALDQHQLADITDHKPAFVNFPQDLLYHIPPLDPGQLVIEVLEDVQPCDEVIRELHKLHKRGYTIALDDYIPAMRPMLECAQIVKVDVIDTPPQNIHQQLHDIRNQGITLLAEKVETHQMFQACKSLGFELFQGYFFARPQLVEGQTIGPNKAAVLAVIAALQDTHMEPADLEAIIMEDSGLTYKILQLVNTTAYARSARIDSVKQAIIRLGMNKIRSLATLMAFTQLDEKPAELQRYTAVRARICEELGKVSASHTPPDVFHMVAVLSCCDAYFDAPLAELIPALPLTEEIKAALLQREGEIGTLLDTAQQLQEANWSSLAWAKLKHLGLAWADVVHAYRDTVEWLNTANDAPP